MKTPILNIWSNFSVFTLHISHHTCLQQESCWVSLARTPLSLLFPLSNFLGAAPALLPGYKSPLFLVLGWPSLSAPLQTPVAVGPFWNCLPSLLLRVSEYFFTGQEWRQKTGNSRCCSAMALGLKSTHLSNESCEFGKAALTGNSLIHKSGDNSTYLTGCCMVQTIKVITKVSQYHILNTFSNLDCNLRTCGDALNCKLLYEKMPIVFQEGVRYQPMSGWPWIALWKTHNWSSAPGSHRGWDGWMASLIHWTWVWVDSGSW